MGQRWSQSEIVRTARTKGTTSKYLNVMGKLKEFWKLLSEKRYLARDEEIRMNLLNTFSKPLAALMVPGKSISFD